MKLQKEIKNKINYLFDILDKNGVVSMVVNFYGSGDDGNMEISDIIDKNKNQKEIDLDEPTIYDNGYKGGHITLWELICEVNDSILDEKEVDYCNNSGNNGCVVFTVEGKKVHMEYQVISDVEYDFEIK